MNQEQFEAACAETIAPYHDPAQDGPLLVSTRMNSKFKLHLNGWETWPEYAAVLGEWPKEVSFFTTCGQYFEDPKAAIYALAFAARKAWQTRQPDCDCAKCSSDPICHCGAALSDHERNSHSYEHSFVGYACTNEEKKEELLLSENQLGGIAAIISNAH